MGNFFYIYTLQCDIDPKRFYTGLTKDLPHRVQNHNAGRVLHTAKWKPWHLKSYIAISDRVRAARLERYLKSASGRAFLKKTPVNACRAGHIVGCTSGSVIPLPPVHLVICDSIIWRIHLRRIVKSLNQSVAKFFAGL